MLKFSLTWCMGSLAPTQKFPTKRKITALCRYLPTFKFSLDHNESDKLRQNGPS